MKEIVKKGLAIIAVIIFLIAIGFFINYYYFFTEKQEVSSFEIGTLFLKMTLAEKESSVNQVSILNKFSNVDFEIKVNNLEDFISVEENRINIGEGEEKNINLNINIPNNTIPGIYLGNLKIVSGVTMKQISIILEIQSEDVYFDSNINLFPGGDIYPGQKLIAEIKISDLARLGISEVGFEYEIRDFSEGVIVQESDQLIVDDKLTLTKTIDLPEDLKLGNYVLTNLLRYDGSVGTSSVFFQVKEEPSEFIFDPESNNSLLIIMIIMIGFFFLIFIGVFVYSVFYRDNLLIELQRQYSAELRKQRQLIQGKSEVAYGKLESPTEKKEFKKEIGVVKKKRLKELKGIYEKKIVEFKQIKKKYTGKTLKKELNKWEKQGYDTRVLEKKYKVPSVKIIKDKIKNWRKQGYDLSLLEKKDKFVESKNSVKPKNVKGKIKKWRKQGYDTGVLEKKKR